MNRETFVVRLIATLTVLALLAGCTPAVTPTPQPAPTLAPSATPVPTVAPTATPLPPTATPLPPTATLLPPTATPDTLKSDLDAILQTSAKAGDFSGAALVARNGQVILSQGYGFADRSKHTPSTPQTKIRISRLTETFTALAILLLQERGKLNVQDKLCKYLSACPDSWKPITLHSLLTASSGLPDPNTYSQPPDQILAEAKSQPLDFEPGTQWAWSRTGSIALGKVIETASGQTYEAFLQQNIFDPLKMSSTGYDHQQADLAVGYPDSGNKPADLWDPQGLYAAGALYSTVEDLYRWDQALYANQLVSAKTLETMLTPYLATGFPSMNSGYGLLVSSTKPRFVEESGGILWFSVNVHHYPDEGILVIVLANQESADVYSIVDSIDHRLGLR